MSARWSPRRDNTGQNTSSCALDEGTFPFVDCLRSRLVGTRRLRPILTVRAGDIVYNPESLGLPEWTENPHEDWLDRWGVTGVVV